MEGRLIVHSPPCTVADDGSGAPTDQHSLQRAENLLAAEVALLEMVARGRPMKHVLDALSRHVEDLCAGCSCSILLVAPDRKHFQVGAGPSLPDAYNDILDGKTIDGGYGPCSLAVLLKAPVITTDLSQDPRWTGSSWLPLMQTYGYDSCWSLPIADVAGDISGIFAIYRPDPVRPMPHEQQLIDRFSKIAAITIDRTRADEALLRREAELSRALSQLAEGQRMSLTGSFTADLQRDEHSWSDEYFRIFEFDPATRPSLAAVRDRIHPDDLELFDREIQHGMAGGHADFTFRIVTPSRQLKYLRGVARLVDYIDDRPIFTGTVQDVTSGKLAEAALSQARSELAHVSRAAALSALTASIAHEVSQPLSGILTNANTCLRLLAAEPANIDGAGETARRTIRDAERAAEVIKRLRAMFAKKEPSVELVDLSSVARELVTLAASELERSNVVLQSDFATDLPSVAGDRVQLQQVILNLLLNGADAMATVRDRAKTLLIQTRYEAPRGVTVLIKDSGVGIDPQAVGKLFNPFFTTKADGMGVGLSISRTIVEHHNGQLWAEPNDGVGATFGFCIPVTLEQ